MTKRKLTPERMAEIAARIAAASPGPTFAATARTDLPDALADLASAEEHIADAEARAASWKEGYHAAQMEAVTTKSALNETTELLASAEAEIAALNAMIESLHIEADPAFTHDMIGRYLAADEAGRADILAFHRRRRAGAGAGRGA